MLEKKPQITGKEEGKTVKSYFKIYVLVAVLMVAIITTVIVSNIAQSTNENYFKQKWSLKDKQHQDLLFAKKILESQVDIIILEKQQIELEAQLWRSQNNVKKN